MASGSGSSSRETKSNFDAMDRLSSSTLKRNPKMELCKTDLLKLLTYLEGELQAREIVIATLKAERVKQLLYQAKYGQFSLNDPFAALQRDSYGAYNPNCDEAAIKAMYNNQLSQVENLILQHRRAQQRLRQHLYDAEQQHGKVVSELEEEIRKHAQDTAQGDDVTYMLEKERERLNQEVELERQQNKKLERELKKVVQAMEQDKLRHKQIVMLLLEERKRIVARLVDEHSKNEEMSQFLSMEKERMTDVVEGLEEESQKSLQMEADLEQQAAEFSREREQLRSCLRQEAENNKQLMEQIESLKKELSGQSRNFSCPLQAVDGKTVHHSEALLSINVLDDEASSDVDSNVDSDPALKTPPTVRELTNSNLAFAGVVTNVNGNTDAVAAMIPTNSLYCATTANNPPAPPSKPNVLRSAAPALPGESSFKMNPPQFLKSLSPVQSGSRSSNSVNTSPKNTTIVTMVNAVASASPTSIALSQQQTANQSNNKQQLVRGVMVTTACSTSPSAVITSSIAAHDVTATMTAITTTTVTITTNTTTMSTQPTSPHVVQVTPRVSVSTSSGARVFTTTQGGKVTFHVTAPPQTPKKPHHHTAGTALQVAGAGRGAPPPIPPNKPILPKKGDLTSVSSTKSPSSVKFGITISKGDGCSNSSSSSPGSSSHIALSSSSGGPTVITATSVPAASAANNSMSPIFKETQPIVVMACSSPLSTSPTFTSEIGSPVMMMTKTTRTLSIDDEDSLAPELADFQQILVSMATTNSVAGFSPTLTSSVTVMASTSTMTCSQNNHTQELSRVDCSPVERLSTILDGGKHARKSSTNSKEKIVVNHKKSSDVGTGSGAGLRNGNVLTGNRRSTSAFRPCVRKVVSPTLPKSFNHMDL